MAGSLDQNNARKSVVAFDHNWQRLDRDDIYRQRVYGTESGASEFIPLNEDRKLSLLSMVVYIIFIIATIQFVWPRVPVNDNFEVNNAIRTSLMSKTYETDPTPKVWNDIENTEDLKSWLLYAFPCFLTPEVQGFNFPIGAVRFTLRRIKQKDNKDAKFNTLAPVIWTYKDGIQLTDKSTSRDDTESFGAYRDIQSIIVKRDKDWEQRVQMRCDGGELLDILEEVRYNRTTVVNMCKDWCEDLVYNSKPCRCWTLSGMYKCEFYYMPQNALQNFTTSGLKPTGRSISLAELAPRVKAGEPDVTLFWPRMKRFAYNPGKDGWYNTPGFVMHLDVYSQEAIISAAQQAGGEVVPLTQSQAVYRKIRDWIQGGLLSRSTVGLAIDFVTYNPNLEVFTWIQLTFHAEASGHIRKVIELTSLRIPMADWKVTDVSLWRDLNFWDAVYVALVVVYVMWEFWELGQRGIKYFYSGWNLLTVVSLVLHICTLVSRYVYLNRAEFTKTLMDLDMTNHQLQTQWTTKFGEQAIAFQDFALFSSLTLLFLWLQLVHYLNDLVPRIGVLVDTMYRSMTPIIFLVIIVADMFIGFVIWANLMFGKSVGAFKDVTESVYSCTELMFGYVDPYHELAPIFPHSGIVFFFVYGFTFIIVLQNLSKAIVLVSYDDATECHERSKVQEEHRKRAAETDSSDYLAKKWKQLQLSIKRFFTRVEKNTYDRDKLVKKYEKKKSGGSKAATLLFVVYCLMYIVMTFWQVQIYWANTLTRSLSSAIEVPTFEKVNSISGQSSTMNNFSTIESRDDVMMFLTHVLPRTLFNSSEGKFETAANPLNTYYSAQPQIFEQLVINNWNIIVGRTMPVRISTRFSKMTQVGNVGTGSHVTINTMKMESSSKVKSAAQRFIPELIEARDDDILNPKTRDFLRRSCSYTSAYAANSLDDRNGYACMLSRDYETTRAILKDMYESDFITSQTSMVAVDFVIYNGYAEAFVYVAITFGFQPSGAITKDITTFTLRLDLYNGGTWLRAVIEVCIILITCFYLGQSFMSMYKDVSELRVKEMRALACHQRIMSIFRGVTLHLLLDPFNLLDLISSFMTVATMVSWYNVVLMKLRDLHFPEQPIWDPAEQTGSWGSDSDVIYEFYKAGRNLRMFIRVCAVNTVIILFRLLKYLEFFPRVRMMFKTLARGLQDIFYFIVMMFVILMGYVTMGHQVFGAQISDFSSLPQSVIACFEMFLGTFDYSKLRRSDTFRYVFFSYTYVILFRYMLINMFFAIIDKSFQEEDKEREAMELRERASEQLEARKAGGPRQPPATENTAARILSAVRQRLPFKIGHTVDPPCSAEDDSHMSGEGEPTSILSATPSESNTLPHETSSNDQQLAIENSTGELDEVKGELTEGVVKRVHNWKYLPQEMRTWALGRSTYMSSLIDEWQRKRKECEDRKEQHDLDRILVDAESVIKEETSRKWKDALAMKKELQKEELKKLKEIHQDQEALAWYIMKREAELKKLEKAKSNKQMRFEEIVTAAKSLISSGDDEGTKRLEESK